MRLLGAVALVAACGGANASPAPPPPPPAESAAPAATAASTTAATTKPRMRTGPAAPGARDGTKPKNGKPLNPHDPMGRTVFVGADDRCFVEVASGDPEVQKTEPVDCPPEANDPAWDHCTALIVQEPESKKCWCVTGRGHPRPMPNPTACPAAR